MILHEILFEAVQNLLPPGTTLPLFLGLTGASARRMDALVTLHDLHAQTLPGLSALGVQAELALLPEEEEAVLLLFRERLRHGISVPLFHVEKRAENLPNETESEESEGSAEFAEGARIIRRIGLVTRIEEGQILWRDNSGGTEYRAAHEELRQEFTHALMFRRAKSRGNRNANIQAALLRWIAYADAYPNRIPTTRAEDIPVWQNASAFLREIAGKRQSPIMTRLRRAANCFAEVESEDDIDAGFFALRQAVFLTLQFSAVVQRALLLSPEMPLSDVERHELIYLARAGTIPIKTIAARRLTSERHHPDAVRTLEQLACDSDAWVRAAAGNP